MDYKSRFHDENIDELFRTIIKLDDLSTCYRFFEDICTVNEIKSLSQRLQVAKMLRKKRTYQDIAEETGASTATISRVNRALIYGANGYNMLLDMIEEDR